MLTVARFGALALLCPRFPAQERMLILFDWLVMGSELVGKVEPC